MTVKKTHNEFVKELEAKYPGRFTVLGKYNGSGKEILVRHNCEECNNYEWSPLAGNLLKRGTCRRCAELHRNDNKRLTLDKVKKNIEKCTNGEYSVIDNQYIDWNSPLKIRHNCEECNNYEWSPSYNNFINGRSRCPKCSSRIPMTKKTYINILSSKYPDYELVSNFVNAETSVIMRHNCEECNNYEWSIQPKSFLDCVDNSIRCPKCSGRYIDTDIFKKRIYNLYKDEYSVLGEYKNNRTKVLVRHNCNICNNYEWDVIPDGFMRDTIHCPKCAALQTESKAIKIIKEYLNQNNIEFNCETMYNECKYINKLKFDIECNDFFIEFDGEQHFSGWSGDPEDLELCHLRDSSKNDYCLNNDFLLIRIAYTEFNNGNLLKILSYIINNDYDSLLSFDCMLIQNGKVRNNSIIYEWYNPINCVTLDEM